MRENRNFVVPVNILTLLRAPFSRAARHTTVCLDRRDWCFGSFPTPIFPDLNPIEEAFSKVKARMKQPEETTTKDIETLITAAFAEITENDCKSWINDSKVYKQI